MHSNLPPKTELNILGLKTQNRTWPELKLNWKFGNDSVSFAQSFQFVGFLHTPSIYVISSMLNGEITNITFLRLGLSFMDFVAHFYMGWKMDLS